ncbi:Haem-binding domain-containing protein [Robiginitalea myxolifaciens]|uniref:Haem-binding domain-containing protein n=1 Tax=Robiginitalea myxolifaciens TaxID=400055 RepID=A0A1I6FMU2_9FLAO|nr:heme-binding domain-containing protein [Robiginitalea myxolifaciens]SFR31198.1 Haem-binding domain-containing protein [Robiginitalea myxolifaciens]
MRSNLVKKIGWTLLIALVAIQFYRPELNTAEPGHLDVFLEETNPPEEVREILSGACYDCHSNQTTYPWYSQVAPVSYWLADHIDHGKGNLNFSEWSGYPADRKDHKLEEIVEEVKSGEMPLNSYTWAHSEARLSETERQALVAWADRTRALYTLNARPE